MEPLAFANHCKANGITIERIAPVLTLSRRFQAGDNKAFTDAESLVSVIYDAPGNGGSVWGTDGGGIGGMVAMNSGVFRMNKSGVQKRWLAKLAKLV